MRRLLAMSLFGLLTACGGNVAGNPTPQVIVVTATPDPPGTPLPTATPLVIVITATPSPVRTPSPSAVATLSTNQQIFATATALRAAQQNPPASPVQAGTQSPAADVLASPTPLPSPQQPTSAPTPAPSPPPPSATAPAPTATAAPPAAAQAAGDTITVAAGQTLPALARQYGVGVPALWAYNGLTNARQVYAGARLKLPPTGYPPPAEVQYLVQYGDTVHKIAQLFGATDEAVAQRNNLANPSWIYVGQKLIVPVR